MEFARHEGGSAVCYQMSRYFTLVLQLGHFYHHLNLLCEPGDFKSPQTSQRDFTFETFLNISVTFETFLNISVKKGENNEEVWQNIYSREAKPLDIH